MTNARNTRRWVSLIGILKAGAFLSVGFSLVTLFDQLHRLLELFSHFRLQYFVVSSLLTLIFVAMRDWKWAGVLLLTTIVNTAPLAAWYLTETEPAPQAAQSITILQANVYGRNNNTALLLEQIATEQPDLIFLQEVTEVWIAAMLQLEASYPYSLAIPRNDNFGIAVYARQPLLDVETIDSPPRSLPSLVVRQSIQGKVVTFVTTHPFPPMGREWTTARNVQLESLAELMVSIPGPKALVGDLNITMWARHYRELIDKTGLRNARYGFGVIPTWPRQLPFAMIPIDHCLVSKEFTVLDVRAGDKTGSDHLPLLIRLSLPTT